MRTAKNSGGVAAAIGSMLYFMRDIDLSLHALATELEITGSPKRQG